MHRSIPTTHALLVAAVAWTTLTAACSNGNSQDFQGFGGDGGGDDSSSVLDAGQPFSAIRPTFGATVVAAVPPPPISGGTLIVSADGRLALAADPDRDLVYGVDLSSGKLLGSSRVDLQACKLEYSIVSPK